jgi:hypothetical protein
MRKFGKGCLVLIGLGIVLGVIIVVLGGGGSSSESAAQPTAATLNAAAQPAGAAATAAAPTSYRVGEDVRVDEVRWKILEATDLGNTLKSQDQFTKDKTTTGRFVRVRFEVENLSKDMLTFAGLDLVDGQGRTFKPSSEVLGFIPNEEWCTLENLNPNVTKICTAIYEVPANATGLQALVGDLKLLGNKTARIDLGL